jgi:hypothetical protein
MKSRDEEPSTKIGRLGCDGGAGVALPCGRDAEIEVGQTLVGAG